MRSLSPFRARLDGVTLPLLVVLAACSSSDAPQPSARAVVARLSSRAVGGPRGASTPVLGASTARGFVRDALGLSPNAASEVTVRLPLAADGPTEVAAHGVGIQSGRIVGDGLHSADRDSRAFVLR